MNYVMQKYDQRGYVNYENIDRSFLTGLNQKNLEPEINEIIETCECDVNKYKWEIQIKRFDTQFKDRENKSICGII